MKIKVNHVNEPTWIELTVSTKLPKNLLPLKEMAHNLWWVWNSRVKELYKSIDPELWTATRHNPVTVLEKVKTSRLVQLSEDKEFIKKMERVYAEYNELVQSKPNPDIPSVAYFSMEYGLTDHLKIYSGGLGVLAGDYLKEASDSKVDMAAVGFLYYYGYFTQTLSVDGQQIANYEAQNFNRLPINPLLDENGTQVIVEVPYPERIVYAKVWEAKVGRVSLYLLDTNFEMNSEFDRSITHQLYGGDWENRIKQEVMLGIGGMLTLKNSVSKKRFTTATKVTLRLSMYSVWWIMYKRTTCRLRKLWNWFVPARSTRYTRPFLPDTTVLTKVYSANTCRIILQNWAFRGRN